MKMKWEHRPPHTVELLIIIMLSIILMVSCITMAIMKIIESIMS